MTNKTVTMSRELAEVFATTDVNLERGKYNRAIEELRALLTAECSEVIPQCSELLRTQAAPIVEADGMGEAVAVPVAWMRFDDDQRAIFTRSKRCNKSEPLYAHPTAYRHVASPPAPVSVVLPDPADCNERHSPNSWIDYDMGWNACLDKVKELNQ